MRTHQNTLKHIAADNWEIYIPNPSAAQMKRIYFLLKNNNFHTLSIKFHTKKNATSVFLLLLADFLGRLVLIPL
jgi:hypothetical protein